MSSIWWAVAAFFGGAVAALLVFASIILLFAVTKMGLRRLGGSAPRSGNKREIGVDGRYAERAYPHRSLHPVAIQ